MEGVRLAANQCMVSVGGGAIDEDELDDDRSDYEPSIDFDCDENAIGPSPKAITAARARVQADPDKGDQEVRDVRRRLRARRSGRHGNVPDAGLVVILNKNGFLVGMRPL